MNFMTTKEAVGKWNISERRIRKLLQDGRIEGAVKVGNTWNIPIDANKPFDRRSSMEEEFIINLEDNYFEEVDNFNKELHNERPISKATLKALRESINYNSNALEGNTLTLKETQVVLEGIAVGGKTIKEHLEVINHKEAIEYLNKLVKEKNAITESNIKNINYLLLKGINDSAGKYRDENIKTNDDVDYTLVPELMEKLIIKYNNWNKYHTIVKASLIHGELVKIHPFMDSNEKTARLMMNLVLMSKGYLPIIIKKEKKLEYHNALEKALVSNDYTNFVKLVNELEIEVLNNLYIML